MFRFTVDTILLYPLMAELRVLKTDHELAVLRYASKCANEAHKEVMRHIRPNMYEYQLERWGLFYCLAAKDNIVLIEFFKL